MEKKNPVLALALAFGVLVLGSFLLLVHIGTAGRTTQKMHYTFNVRGAASAASSYIADAKRGSAVIQKKAGSILDGIFGGDAAAASSPASGTAQTASGGKTDAGQGAAEDPFEKFYQENYADKFGPGGEYNSSPESGRPSLASSGGGRSLLGGGGFGSNTASAPGSRNNPKKGADLAAAPPSAANPASGPKPAFGGPASGGSASGKGRSPAPPPLFASNTPRTGPAGSGPGSGSSSGYGGGSSSSGGKGSNKAGGISGMSGGAGPGGAVLDGASENMSAGAKSSYNSKMSGGAASAAAGGAAPAAPAAKASKGGGVGGSGGGSGGGSSGGSAGGSDGAAGDKKTAKTNPAAAAKTDAPLKTYTPPAASSDSNFQPEVEDLLKTIVSEKLNGKDVRYISEDEKSASSMDGLLKTGATDGDSADKKLSVSTGPADPEDLAQLSPERKTELKKKTHNLLKRMERKYGAMQDITCTSCRTTPEVCKDKGLKGSYLTMKTAQNAALVVSFKYVKQKWRVHTVDFRDPSSAPSDFWTGRPGGGHHK